MNLSNLIQKFKNNPCYLSNGAGSLAKKWGVSEEMVKSARRLARSNEEQTTVSGINVGKGETTKEVFCTKKPQTIEEIKRLFEIDDITCSLSQYWIKERKNGYYVSALIKSINTLADSSDKLQDIIKKALSDVKSCDPVIKKGKITNNSLVVYISDDHVGMVVEDDVFRQAFSTSSYKGRLMQIFEEVDRMNNFFDEIVVLSLGDQMNGWSEQTTRGGHRVASTSNVDQFNEYVSARKVFYDALFTSGRAEKYKVFEVNNSNHSGLGFSYMANECLRTYVTLKYPLVEFHNPTTMVVPFKLNTGHIIFAVHGKDERHQKNSFPLNLDAKTETWFMDFMLEMGVNPKKEYCTVVKGDLHRFNINEGKNFRYVNIPSVANGSDWQDSNFGTSKPGAVIEIFSSMEEYPTTRVVRF